MLDKIFDGIFDNGVVTIGVGDFLLCIATAIMLGLLLALAYSYRSRSSQSFVVTLALLPAVVCVVIMMVNGNIGAGVAVAGAFSLVRFRSAPGTAKEIVALFIGMGTGLIAGMGYLAFAALFTVVMGVAIMIYSLIEHLRRTHAPIMKSLRITVPEDLDYPGVFDGIIKKYASSFELVKVKTVNMGTMIRLTYSISIAPGASEKELIDRLRERNGNLEISLALSDNIRGEL